MNLQGLRSQIDRIDEKIVRLLVRRVETARKIGATKNRAAAPVLDKKRERQVLARVRAAAGARLRGRELEAIYRQIMAMCARIQREQESSSLRRRG